MAIATTGEPWVIDLSWIIDEVELDAVRLRWEYAVRVRSMQDAELDRWTDEQRAIDRAILAGFDRCEPVDLDTVIAAVAG